MTEILGTMKTGPVTLMLYTVAKNLHQLGYVLEIYVIEDGKSHSTWETIGGQISILSPERFANIDWSIFEGVLVDSIEANEAVSSLMQEPYRSVPLIWIIQDDTLANRLPAYEDLGWHQLISYWKNAFSRADVVVFSDFSLPMLYSALDTGNFFVIPGSPVDAWAAESYRRVHSKVKLKKDHGFSDDDRLVIVVGSSLFYNELSWDYAVAMHDLGPLLTKYALGRDSSEAFKFLFLCGNSTDGYDDALQDEQGFPSLLTRAMTFEIPIIAPDFPIIGKYVVDGVHGMIYAKHKPDELVRAFSQMVSNGRLTEFAQAVGATGRLLARDMQALDCIRGYAQLLENVLTFPSDALLPGRASQLNEGAWKWNLFRKDLEDSASDLEIMDQKGSYLKNLSVVYALEKDQRESDLRNVSEDGLSEDFPTELDWEILTEIENSIEVERLEMEEVEERMEKDLGIWDEIYRNARRAEKLKFEKNEMDEGELERTGQMLCVYEVYDGVGAWPHLHHGSLYRGLTLTTRARRLRSDDINAIGRLPLLNNSYYRDVLCEMGGMFSVANSVDNIHKRPWIGFQSWRAAARKVSLSPRSEKVLEETIHDRTKGDFIYFWAPLDMAIEFSSSNKVPPFWSVCEILNGGNCRYALLMVSD